MAGQLALHPDFEAQMRTLLGNSYTGYKHSLEQLPCTSIRLNPKKQVTGHGDPVPWSDLGYYLPERPVFTLDPLFHAGAYYVQEASSMFLEQAVRQTGLAEKPLRILDLCAAPGGKSTHLLSLMHPESLLVSNEAIRGRTAVLSENLIKWGYPNLVVTNNDPKDFGALPGFFDAIVVDAPCSGEGLFRKDVSARNEWSHNHVRLCSRRQQRILEDVWPALKQNGILIYSTCTYNVTENEAIIEGLINRHGAEPVAFAVPDIWNIQTGTGVVPGYRFYPHRVKGEGFFLAVVRKSKPQKEIHVQPKKRFMLLKQNQHAAIAYWLMHPEHFSFFEYNKTVRIIPEIWLVEIQFLAQQLNVLEAGTALATASHNKLMPEHAAALSIGLNKSAFPCIDLSRHEALTYLRKESLSLSASGRGVALISFKNIPLGWVNILPNRINNLYPAAWRIRMKP